MSKLLIFAGPNGAGKSTITKGQLVQGHYVNADEIKRKLGCSELEAAQIAERTREFLLEHEEDFTFETVLSTPRNIDLMRRAKEKGYYISCIYVLTSDPSINVLRVEERVRQGEHDVPTEKIISRYHRSLALISTWIQYCDEVYIFDNSGDRSISKPSLIVSIIGGVVEITPCQFWTLEQIEKLIST